MTIRNYDTFCLEEVLGLYESVGWTNYIERAETLPRAFENSLCVLGAYEGDSLIGFLRAVGDGVTVLFVQDLLVRPDWQRKGVGSALMRELLRRYETVYQTELLADGTEELAAFYAALGFRSAEELGCRAFVKMRPAIQKDSGKEAN